MYFYPPSVKILDYFCDDRTPSEGRSKWLSTPVSHHPLWVCVQKLILYAAFPPPLVRSAMCMQLPKKKSLIKTALFSYGNTGGGARAHSDNFRCSPPRTATASTTAIAAEVAASSLKKRPRHAKNLYIFLIV